jgi:hypothetical protein
MGWKENLQRLIIAGGTLALTDCQGCCNANPDPCCWAPEGAECKTKEACEAMGQGFTHGVAPDGASALLCEPLDAAPADQSVPDLSSHDHSTIDAAESSDGGNRD